MKKYSLVFTIIMFLLFLDSGCRLFHLSKSVPGVSGESANVLEESFNNRMHYNSLILKDVFVSYNINSSKKDFNCSIKIIKDSLIILSIASVLGIEIFRVYLNKDSVFVIDRVNKWFTANGFTREIEKYSGFLDFQKIQDLVLGNVVEISDLKDFRILNSSDKYSKFGVIKELSTEKESDKIKIYYIINNDIRKPYEFSWRSNSDYFHLIYDDYKFKEGVLYPGNIGIEIKNKFEKYNISVEIGNLKISNGLNYHIAIPDGYKRKI